MASYDEQVLIHPFIIGEIACSSIKNRDEIITLLGALPAAIHASHEEALILLEKNRLYAHGIGWIDIHLLASALLSKVHIWTLDKKLGKAAEVLHLSG